MAPASAARDDNEAGSAVGQRYLYVAALAATAAALLELRLLLRLADDGALALWLVHYVVYHGCVLVSLLVLRRLLQSVGSTAGLAWIVLTLCVLHALAPFVGIGPAVVVGEPAELGLPAQRVIEALLFFGLYVVPPMLAALYALFALRVRRHVLQGNVHLSLFGALASVGAFLPTVATSWAFTIGSAGGMAGLLVLGAYFVRAARGGLGSARVPQPRDHTPQRGWALYLGGIALLSAILAVLAEVLAAGQPGQARVIEIIVVGLLIPQYRTLELLDVPEHPALLFGLSLVYLPILFFPVGARLIWPEWGPVWATAVVQVVFLVVFLCIAAVALITGIQM